MVNNKILYKIILVLGLLFTMILTLSLTEYTLAYAEEVQPPVAETGKDTDNTNDRFDFDTEMLEKAREIIGTESELSDAQTTALHQLGFNDRQILLLIEITQDDTAIDPMNQPNSMIPIILCITLLLVLCLIGIVYFKRHRRIIA